MCHVSCVMCHVSRVMCHVSHVTYHIYIYIFFLLKKHEFFFDMWQVTRDRWHVTGDTWQVTRDTWHMTHDKQCGMNHLSKFQLSSSSGLGLTVFWIYFHKTSVSQLLIDEPVYRTARATPGLLINWQQVICVKTKVQSPHNMVAHNSLLYSIIVHRPPVE